MSKPVNEIVQEVVASIEFEEIIKKQAEESIRNTLKKAVEEQFRSYSTFSKELEDHLSKTLLFDLGEIKAPDFKTFFIETINRQLSLITTPELATEIKKHIDLTVIGESREIIPFDQFIEEVIEKADSELDDDEKGSVSLIVEKEDKSYGSYFNLDISRKVSGYSSDRTEVLVHASFSGKNGHLYYSRGESHYLSGVKAWFKSLEFRRTKIEKIREYSHEFEPDYD